MMKALAKIAVRPILGKSSTQWLFESMRQLALVGMNYGDAGSLRFSGEDRAFEHVLRSLGGRLNRDEHVVVLDVGANVGNYALMVASRLLSAFPKGQVYAVEPSSTTFAALTENLKRVDAVHLHQVALGDHQGTGTLFQVHPLAGYASLCNREEGGLKHFGLRTATTEEVPISTVDAFCMENRIDHIHFMKIDTEGAELKVLLGARAMLEDGAIDNIQFEFSEGCLDFRSFLKDFFELLGGRYRISRILRNGFRPLPKYQPQLEVFACANYLAEKSQLELQK